MIASLLGGKVLQWFLGPAGKMVLLVVAFAGWTLYQRYDATRDCEATEAVAQLKESQRQLEIAKGIAEGARERANVTETEITILEGQLDELKQNLRGDPANRCIIPDDVRERLLRIK